MAIITVECRFQGKGVLQKTVKYAILCHTWDHRFTALGDRQIQPERQKKQALGTQLRVTTTD